MSRDLQPICAKSFVNRLHLLLQISKIPSQIFFTKHLNTALVFEFPQLIWQAGPSCASIRGPKLWRWSGGSSLSCKRSGLDDHGRAVVLDDILYMGSDYSNAMLTFLSRASKAPNQSSSNRHDSQSPQLTTFRSVDSYSASVQHTPSTNTIRSL